MQACNTGLAECAPASAVSVGSAGMEGECGRWLLLLASGPRPCGEGAAYASGCSTSLSLLSCWHKKEEHGPVRQLGAWHITLVVLCIAEVQGHCCLFLPTAAPLPHANKLVPGMTIVVNDKTRASVRRGRGNRRRQRHVADAVHLAQAHAQQGAPSGGCTAGALANMHERVVAVEPALPPGYCHRQSPFRTSTSLGCA